MTFGNQNLDFEGLAPFEAGKDSCGVGFVADIKGRRSHAIVDQGLQVLVNLAHRGASGAEVNTGDGAGILIQVPDKFLRREAEKLKIVLPHPGQYAAGMIFLPRDPAQAAQCRLALEKEATAAGGKVLGWREVPTRNALLGPTARSCEPQVAQVFIGWGPDINDSETFERRLYLAAKRVENAADRLNLPQRGLFYIVSLSSRTLVYKGMLTPAQVAAYYPDLKDLDLESAVALIHSRFSTNTFPSWELAQPFRFLAHNGEINTLRGNINWMRARENRLSSRFYTETEMKSLLPVIREGGSDSSALDDALQLLVRSGRTLPHSMMMLIPEAWSGHMSMPAARKDFYHFHACLMEPWDGPASVAFTDGNVVGAVLDRNGLRPSRITLTKDGLVVMASEAGVLEIDPENVQLKTRLEPGKIFLVDMEQGRVIGDAELKEKMAASAPFGEWLARNLRPLKQLPLPPAQEAEVDLKELLRLQAAFGYTREDLKLILAPMAINGEEPVGSMGEDTPPAVLSERPQLLFSYFKQLFAQVTNPPLDSIREALVTSTLTWLGAKGGILEPSEANCRQIELPSPLLDMEDLARLKDLKEPDLKSATLSILFETQGGHAAMAAALEKLCGQAEKAVAGGASILILSDRGVGPARAPLPSLLAVAAVHRCLVIKGVRNQASLILESGEPREVHHFALLLGYGVTAVHPWLALETLLDLKRLELLPAGLSPQDARKNYLKSVVKGIVKTMSKMGIATVQSYRGAQIFEALGLGSELVDKYFTHTPSRIQGIGLEEIARETLARHGAAFPRRLAAAQDLESGGRYKWRRDGERHLLNPETISRLQAAVRTGNYQLFKEYSHFINDQAGRLFTLRGLIKFKKRESIPLQEVEPASEIVKRFTTGAMSYGSISKEAHECLAIAMNRLAGKSNSGEGGEDETRFKPDPNGNVRNSATKQVASGRFGVTSHYLVNARQIQIKIAQGAKPGEGGQLPARKVYPWIAKTRHSTPYVALISPPPHHDIYSIEDLAQLIWDLKCANPLARISVKLVSEVGVGTVAAGVCKAHADHVLISGYDGGTGASPLSSIKHAGLPWELGLAETHQLLVKNRLRDRIAVEVDGQLRTGRDVVIAALLGAEEFGFATGPLVASGCVMMRVCHLDTCPVGVATQNAELRKKFTGRPEHVVNFMMFMAEEAREFMAHLGFRTVNEMVGHSEALEMNEALAHWKAKKLDYSRIFFRPQESDDGEVRCTMSQDHGLSKALDSQLMERCRPAIEHKTPVKLESPIRNTHRAVGTLIGSEISRHWGSAGLPEDTLGITFTGSAGQSFGAFLPSGVSLRLEGEANDYLGKGLSGGKIIVYPPRRSSLAAEENVIVGNVLLYGATAGWAYIRGLAGERFAVRNSGARAVVEGLGDHGCEYMTGGCVAVLGPTGRNFAAGMSGGVAFVRDPDGTFKDRCNLDMVGLEPLDAQDREELKDMVTLHLRYTASALARRILDNWEAELKSFVKVMPTDYKKALAAQKSLEEQSS